MDITIIYRVDPEQVNTLHQNWRTNYEDGFARPTVRALARDVASRYTAAQIYGETRTEMRDAMEQSVQDRFAEEGLELIDLLLRDVTFSEDFTNAIEDAQVAEQQALREQIRIRQEQQQAEQVRVRAAGERDAAIARAEGEAQSIILRAQAEAEALRLVSEQVAANPSLIQYLYVQNLSDNVNIALVPSGSPFLFDFASLAEPDPNFQAPTSDFDADSFSENFVQPSGVVDPELEELQQEILGGGSPTPTPEPPSGG